MVLVIALLSLTCMFSLGSSPARTCTGPFVGHAQGTPHKHLCLECGLPSEVTQILLLLTLAQLNPVSSTPTTWSLSCVTLSDGSHLSQGSNRLSSQFFLSLNGSLGRVEIYLLLGCGTSLLLGVPAAGVPSFQCTFLIAATGSFSKCKSEHIPPLPKTFAGSPLPLS